MGIDQNRWIVLFRDTVSIYGVRIFFYRIFIVFGRHQIFLIRVLSLIYFTLDLLLFFIENFHILFESFLCFLPFRIIFLKILTEIDEMDLDLKISFSNIIFFCLEVLLVSR